MAERNVGLMIDNLDTPTVRALLSEFNSRVGYLGFSNTGFLSDTETVDRLHQLRTNDLGLLLDTQLAGGLNSMSSEATKHVRRHHPDLVTISAGVSAKGIVEVLRSIRSANGNSPVRVLLTSVLPEIDDQDFITAFPRINAEAYTIHQAELAQALGVSGLYGAGIDATDYSWGSRGLEYVATGISPDGEPYGNKVRTCTLKRALSLGSTIVFVGSALNREDTVDERVKMFGEMLEG